jgi:adenosylcobinamide kinase/adenosylcobinamide-phosphate guanylyltransferase
VGQLVLILGGARSGKSTFAQKLALERGGESVLYVATAEGGDEEMRLRIAQHQIERPLGWRTLEAPRYPAREILVQAGKARVILLDCLTLLVSNLLLDHEKDSQSEAETAIMVEMKDLASCARKVPGDLLLVSNEVGLGLVPPYPLGRTYRDVLGRVNQFLAAEADCVAFLVAGLPMWLKRAT